MYYFSLFLWSEIQTRYRMVSDPQYLGHQLENSKAAGWNRLKDHPLVLYDSG